MQVVTVMRAEVAPAPALELHGRQEAEQEEPASTPHEGTGPGFLDRTLTGAKSIMPRWAFCLCNIMSIIAAFSGQTSRCQAALPGPRCAAHMPHAAT